MKNITRQNLNKTNTLPIKVIQFGEGNFLRAFADWMVEELNEKASYQAGVAIVQPIEHGMVKQLANQDGLYHLLLRGMSDGEVKNDTHLISCVQQLISPFEDLPGYFELAKGEDLKLIFSNTTEAGIVFDKDDTPTEGALANTFPGKLTQLLFARYQFFEGDHTAGVGIIPCELIDKNGVRLKDAILQFAELWGLPESFVQWIHNSNYFANTLVDRIVTGFPSEEIVEIQQDLGYADQMVVAAELFHLWIIEGPSELQELFPAHLHGLNVKYVEDQTPYRTRKVRILNGPHTSMVAVGMLAGLVTVKETIEDVTIGPFVRKLIFEEIIPTIDLPEHELVNFAHEVIERFMNPFIRHELQSISLNSISKFKVRVLPTILDYINQRNEAPKRLCIAFACLIKLYLEGVQGQFTLYDDAGNLEFFRTLADLGENRKIVHKVLSNQAFWDQDLTINQVLLEEVTDVFANLDDSSVMQIMETIPSS